MNIAENWALLLVEGSILASSIVVILAFRRELKVASPKKVRALSGGRKNLENQLEKMNQLLKESETLSSDLSQNLAEKREMVKKLVEALDGRIQTLQPLLEKGNPESPIPAPAVPGKDPIVEMAIAGCEVGEISKRLGLSKEEVQLILDLRKITTP
jgi:hypothetical protein